MESSDDDAGTLAALADFLHERRAAILAAWSHAAEGNPDLTTSATLSRVQFYDHIPHMLDALEHRLRATGIREALEAKKDENANAEGHGLQRWQQGYNEREVMVEWIALNRCLAAELETYAAERPTLQPSTMSAAWRLVSEFSVAGMAESVAQYTQLQKAEAAGRAQALEQALAQVGNLERKRAEAWREAAHDLRGNLSIVTNVTHVLQMKDRAGADARDSLRMLQSGIASLHALLDDLTAQARLDAGHEQRNVHPFDAAMVLAELCANSQTAASARGLFLATAGPSSLRVEGDEVKVCRIAQNLILNAIKYTSRGGIRVTWEEASEGPARWVLCVQDTGPGLESGGASPLATAIEAATRDNQTIEEDAARSGEASADPGTAPTLASRSEPEAVGEGIGLSIVKRLCELLDASLELQTERGQGTTFRVTFPKTYPKG